ncbi:siroheme decarboxylase subunit beta [Pseudomonas veronii]|uniref:siroheme decarboxylase subunit beta n=1 Tax=Pseudomonas veronii TaxID=76761 RepID=UPI0028F6F22A|nr:hypothetical protein [Pseudomonas veronii]
MDSELKLSAFRLLNEWQHGFPLASRPFKQLGHQVGLSEDAVLAHFQTWHSTGVLSRIGPVLHPACFASALVGMQVPADRFKDVADRITALNEVNHNYERKHAINLWFVVACRTPRALEHLIENIHRDTGCRPISLPMEAAYHIDLGFSLSAAPKTVSIPPRRSMPLPTLGSPAWTLLSTVQHGIELVPHPYRALAQGAGLKEADVLLQLAQWQDQMLFRRFGIVLRHRKLGYRANAMCVWNVDDNAVDRLGLELGQAPGVTLCYRRRRQLPDWPYNLFCMIHGKTQESVVAQRAHIAARIGLDTWPHDILFSSRCFKQRGALFLPEGMPHD